MLLALAFNPIYPTRTPSFTSCVSPRNLRETDSVVSALSLGDLSLRLSSLSPWCRLDFTWAVSGESLLRHGKAQQTREQQHGICYVSASSQSQLCDSTGHGRCVLV
jgi:hypothetical protein